MKKLVTEFVGTFFLVFTIGMVVISGTPNGALAIGAVLIGMVYLGGHVSGAHYNPAVSLAILVRGKMSLPGFVAYVLSQLLGSIAAASLVHVVTGKVFLVAPDPAAGIVAPLAIEVLFTFALALVILNVAFSKSTAGNSYYGVAIGLTVFAGATVGGSISGGAFNPAVGTGPMIVDALIGKGGFPDLWLYLVGPFSGSLLAAVVFGLQGETE